MPRLPSGRRIEFSLDRFHALLARLPLAQAIAITAALRDADDLLPVLDAVHFTRHEGGTPYYADYVAADWELHATEWTLEDQDGLRRWLITNSARYHRLVAIREIRARIRGWAEDSYPGSQPVAGNAFTQIDGACERLKTANPGRQPARIAFARTVHHRISTNIADSLLEFEKHTPMARVLH